MFKNSLNKRRQEYFWHSKICSEISKQPEKLNEVMSEIKVHYGMCCVGKNLFSTEKKSAELLGINYRNIYKLLPGTLLLKYDKLSKDHEVIS